MEMGWSGLRWRDLLMLERIVVGVLNQSSLGYVFPAMVILSIVIDCQLPALQCRNIVMNPNLLLWKRYACIVLSMPLSLSMRRDSNVYQPLGRDTMLSAESSWLLYVKLLEAV